MGEYSEIFVAFDVAKKKLFRSRTNGGCAGRSAILVTTAWWLRQP